MSKVNKSRYIISQVIKKSDNGTCCLFYSGGKDSLAVLDLIKDRFSKIYCIYLYLVKNPEYMQEYFLLLKKHPNVELIQLPHPILAGALNNGVFQVASASKSRGVEISFTDIERYVMAKTSSRIFFYGYKKIDSLSRRSMFNALLEDCIVVTKAKTIQCFPLGYWKGSEVRSYLKHRGINKTQTTTNTHSSGMNFKPENLLWLKDNFPTDYVRLRNTFPLIDGRIFHAKGKNVSDNPIVEEGHQERPVQPKKNRKRRTKQAQEES